ncbi:MAG: ROK family protein [Bacteroidia bacterium]|nr:ROK family protein [Bacteroidia bacterium]
MKAVLAAGIDIGGTNTVFGLVDSHGKIHARGSIATNRFTDPEAFTKEVATAIHSILPAEVRLLGVGIGAPSGNFFSGSIEYAPNMPWKGVIPLASYFSRELGCPSWLTNDANAAAIGEMLFGAARGKKDFIFVTLGTGLGSGIVVNGELVYGHDGMAGELGHVTVIRNGRLCGCGKYGCLETYCSATGLVITYKELKKLEKVDGIDAKYIYTKAMEGEAGAAEAFSFTGRILGEALANAVAFTSPNAIYLFGGLAKAGDLILHPTLESFEKNLLHIYRNKVTIHWSGLPGADAAILGAASLVYKELESH